jgi:O-antigen ligase
MLGWPTHWLLIIPAFLFGFMYSSNKESLLKSPESKILAVYIGYIFITTFINVGYWHAREEFLKILKAGSIFYMFYLLLDDGKKVQKTLICFLILGVLLSEHAIQQAITGTGWAGIGLDPKYTEIRAKWLGIWDGSNSFGLLLGIILPIGLEIAFNHHVTLFRLASLVFSLMISAGIYFTNSRGSILAVICGLVFYVFSRWKLKQSIVIVLCMFVFAGALLPSRMGEIDTRDSSVRQRSWVWEQGIRMLKSNPIIGVGKGQFAKHNEDRILAHNNYVQVFSETGLVGYFVFISFLWFPLKRSFKLQWKKKQTISKKFDMLRVINTSFVVFLAGTFFISMENDILSILLALTSCITLQALKEEGKNFEKIQKADIAGIIICMVTIYSAVWLIAIKEII